MAELYRLSNRSNINVYNYPEQYGYEKKDRRIIIYDDHRTILDVLYYAIQEGHFGEEIPTIISLDHHDDAVRLSPEQKRKASAVRKSCLKKRNDVKLWKYVEFELCGLDDDWVRAGMELGIIKNYIGIGHSSAADNIDQGYEQYRSGDKVLHHLYSNGHLDSVLGNRGVIGDMLYNWPQKQKDLFDDIQWHNGQFDDEPIVPFVLDIDLDCFSTDCEGRTMAWPETIFAERYIDNFKVNSFVRQLISRSSLITICREFGCCGGIGESNRILELLDYYWFSGVLRTRRIV